MYRDRRFDLASDHSSMMKVAYLGTEIEGEDIVPCREYCEQDPNRKIDHVSGRDDGPWQKHREQGPGSIHRACTIRRNGFQT